MTWSHIPWNPPPRMLRQFAALFAAVSGILGVTQWWWDRPVLAAVLAGLGVAVGLAGWLRPQALRWLFVGWVVLVFPIGWLVLHACLAVVYFGILTPMGLIFRLRGRDALQLKPHPENDSYWQDKPEQPVANYYKTF
jgi:Saxitoxin biosynthesis operon protein SxtJ